MDRVNNRFEHCKALRRQADTSANYNANTCTNIASNAKADYVFDMYAWAEIFNLACC